MAPKPTPKIVYLYPKLKTLRECLLYIGDWNTQEGAKLYIALKHRGKGYSADELELINKSNISIARPSIKANQLSYCTFNDKGQLCGIPYKVLRKIIKENKNIQKEKADIVEIIEKEFRKVLKIIGKCETAYCDISVNLYKLRPKEELLAEKKLEAPLQIEEATAETTQQSSPPTDLSSETLSQQQPTQS